MWFRRERDLRDELEAHRRMAAENGEAERAFGNYDLVAETTRDQWAWRWLASLGRDLRLALRDLDHHHGYAGVAIVTFGLAMAAFAAIYGMGDAIYYHPLPYVPHENRLAWLGTVGHDRGGAVLAPAEFRYVQAAAARPNSAIAHPAAFTAKSLVWDDKGAPVEVTAAQVTAGYLPLLQTNPAQGRPFTPSDYRPGARAVILGYNFWRAQLGGAAGLVGSTLVFNGEPYTVAGIMAHGVDLPEAADVMLPLIYTPLQWAMTWRQLQSEGGAVANANELVVWARLRRGVSWKQANAELAAISPGLPEDGSRAPRLHAVPVQQRINGNLTPVFIDTLLGAMGFLLLLACANVANLNLARASARQHELALRASLGASRARLVQMLLLESLLLAFLGGIFGVLLARPMLHLLGAGAPKGFHSEVIGFNRIGINAHVMLLAFLICVVAGIVSGLAPAWRVFRERASLGAMRTAPGRSGHEGSRARQWLVGAQAALALILLTCTALMFTSFSHFSSGTRRFQPAGVVTFAVNLPASRYATTAQRDTFYHKLLGRLRVLPGVSSAVALTTTPFSNDGAVWVHYADAGAPAASNYAVEQDISPGYFHSLHVALLQGRGFSSADAPAAPPVALVSETLARARWPGASAVGKQVRIGAHGPWVTVVGVAADAEYSWENQGAKAAIYRPLAQTAPAQSVIAVRSPAVPTSLVPAIRRQAAQLDSQLPLLNLQPLPQAIAFSLTPIYLLGYMMSALGVIALMLALAGLYGVAAYNAQRRLRELGIRAVCGARPGQLTRLMVRRGMIAVSIGLALGAAGAVLFERAAAGFFFGVQPDDPWPLVGAAVLLCLTALLASYLPAQRAAASDPMRVLREE